MRGFFVFAALTFISASFASALDFSADMVSTARGGGSFSGKMFVSGDKTRMEAAGAITITRIDKGVTWLIVPEQNMFIEQPLDVSRVAGATDKVPGEIERTPVGKDVIDGRAAEKYRVVYTEKGQRVTIFQWIDDATGVPIKTISEDGSWSVEYRNLNVGKQPDAIFEIPSQYAKSAMPDMAGMMAAAQQEAARQMARQEEE